MLDAVVRVEIREVKRVLPVTPIEHVRSVVRHEEAKRRRKVVRLAHEPRQLAEGNVTPRMRQDAWQDRRAKVSRCGTRTPARTDDAPWFAMALRAGHEQRLSPSPGGTNSGHLPPKPGCPSGIRRPALWSGVRRLKRKRRKSTGKRTPLMRRPPSAEPSPRDMRLSATIAIGRGEKVRGRDGQGDKRLSDT